MTTPPRTTVAVIERDVVRVVGPDAATYLQGQLSQDVTPMAPGATEWSFVLQPQGKVDAWVRVHRVDADTFELDVDAGWGEAVLARLLRFKLRTNADLTLLPAMPVLAVRGLDVAVTGWSTESGARPAAWPGTGSIDLFGPGAAGAVPAGAETVGHDEHEALRMVHGVPAMGSEITEATIPAELGAWVVQVSASFTKGCFTGQELLARIDSRGGNVPRTLRRFAIAGPAGVPAGGSGVMVGDQVAGQVTSATTDPAGAVVGLAFVKRAFEPPFEALVEGAVTQVRAVPTRG